MIPLSTMEKALRLARTALIECGSALDDANVGGAASYDDAMEAIDGALAALSDRTPQFDVSGIPMADQLYGKADEADRAGWPSTARAMRAAGRALDAGFKTCGRADCAGASGGKASLPGWKLVPAEPTDEMLYMMVRATNNYAERLDSYSRMLAAAGAAPLHNITPEEK